MENHRELTWQLQNRSGRGSFGAATAKFEGATPGAVSTLYSVYWHKPNRCNSEHDLELLGRTQSVYIWRFSKMGDPQVTMGFEYVTKLS